MRAATSGVGTKRQLAGCSDMSGVRDKPEVPGHNQNGAFDPFQTSA